MPAIHPVQAVCYAPVADPAARGVDISDRIAPPYDVLTDVSKRDLLARSAHNIVAVDLPHLPAKALGPQETYDLAGEQYHKWLADGVLKDRARPAVFVYQQSYQALGRSHQRRGLIANLNVQPFGPAADGSGGIFPHEQTFSAAKEDRLRLMKATRTQLSPIFGLYSDASNQVGPLLEQVVRSGPAHYFGRTVNDNVLHEVWAVDDAPTLEKITAALRGRDTFIADGHHRYNTALNYLRELESSGQPVPPQARRCMFVLIAMEDPGMIVLPTHRVLGGMKDFSLAKLQKASAGMLTWKAFPGSDLAALEKALPGAGVNALGIYLPHEAKPADRFWIVQPSGGDPLAKRFPNASPAWRSLDVAIVQHLLVEDICQPTFCTAGEQVAWKFPHALDEVQSLLTDPSWQMGVIVQPTPLRAVRSVSEAGELMPQKSTFFYPKLATGLVLNRLQ